MANKASDRMKALQERAAALAQRSPTDETQAPQENEQETGLAAASIHFGAAIEHLIHNRTVQRIPITQIAPDTNPDTRQPRLLPRPEELIVEGEPLPAYRLLVEELLALGESLKERQIQPVVVYAGTAEGYPDVRYLILVGQRRWTAAWLSGIETLDAVVVEPPTPAERVRIRYAENEDRAEFSDMERAWALQQMKDALSDQPWEEVETRLQMSRARRQQLLRMLAFTPQQQHQIALLRLQETQARPLHSSLRQGELSSDTVDTILHKLETIAAERSAARARSSDAEGEEGGKASRRTTSGIDGSTVTRLVARALRATQSPAPQATPRWLPTLHEQLERTSTTIQRALERVEMLDDNHRDDLRANAAKLHTQLTTLLKKLEE
jgi:ParB/RepB/Spo0J family partition protein